MDNNKCTKCGAELKYNADKEKLQCEHCHSEFYLADNINISPNYIIPFKYTKDDAISIFNKKCKEKKLKPNCFSKKNINKNLKCVYIPFFLYSFECSGYIEAQCKEIKKWDSGNYKYTKTDEYRALRSGSMLLENITVKATNKVRQDIINKVGLYNFKQIKNFDSLYIKDYLVYDFGVNKEDFRTKAMSLAEDSFVDILKKDITGYNKVDVMNKNVKLKNIKENSILLPMFILDINYKKNIYTFIMNGQTGKVDFTIPKSKFKAIIIWLTLFIIITVIMFLLVYFKVIL